MILNGFVWLVIAAFSVILIDMTDSWTRKAIKWMDKADKWIRKLIDNLFDWIEKKNLKIKKIFDIADQEKYKLVKKYFKNECEKNEIYFEDLNEIMSLEKNKNLWLFNGNFHLTDLGTNIATNQILKNY